MEVDSQAMVRKPTEYVCHFHAQDSGQTFSKTEPAAPLNLSHKYVNKQAK